MKYIIGLVAVTLMFTSCKPKQQYIDVVDMLNEMPYTFTQEDYDKYKNDIGIDNLRSTGTLNYDSN